MLNNNDPKETNSLYDNHFREMTDPRRINKGNYYHPLNEILFLVISAVISGADGWTSIAVFGKAKLGWLREFLPYENGIPSHDVLGKLFARLSADEFTVCFTNWVNSISDLTDGDVVAIDGKTIRNSNNDTSSKSAIHLVSAYASEHRICLGQEAVHEKSNEITAIPKLLEETDYSLELQNSMELCKACNQIPNIVFAQYYPELSSQQILSMDWLDGQPLRVFLQSNPSQEIRNKLGQVIWDFYSFQIHKLRKMHADPHPGNFIVTPENKLAIIDFGCVKVIPNEFYEPYFKLVEYNLETDYNEYINTLYEMRLLLPDDNDETVEYLSKMFSEMIGLVGQPFNSKSFDFGNEDFFNQIYAVGIKYGQDKKLRKIRAARGMKDAIYVNRTHIGMFSILNEIRANVNTIIPQDWTQKNLT